MIKQCCHRTNEAGQTDFKPENMCSTFMLGKHAKIKQTISVSLVSKFGTNFWSGAENQTVG